MAGMAGGPLMGAPGSKGKSTARMAAMDALLSKLKGEDAGDGGADEGTELVECPMCHGTGKADAEDAQEYLASPLAKDEAAEGDAA